MAQDLEKEFAQAKRDALSFIAKYNAALPSANRPGCGDEGHVPGLRCPTCGYRHAVAWTILRDGEWGYEVIALCDRKKILARFDVN